MLRVVSNSSALGSIVFLAILLNFIFLGVTHNCDGQDYCPTFQLVQECANLFFTFVFAFELCVKLPAYNPLRFVLNVYNFLDVVVVAVSLAELPTSIRFIACFFSDQLQCDSTRSGVGALRMLRLLRFVKLFAAFPSLQRQLRAIGASLAAVGSLLLLLFLFLLIFSILGNSIFGGRFALSPDDADIVAGTRVTVWDPLLAVDFPASVVDIDPALADPLHVRYVYPPRSRPPDEWLSTGQRGSTTPVVWAVTPRKNFDTIAHSAIAVLMILTFDDWPHLLWVAARSQGYPAALFFVSVIIIGNFLLFNLFVAIVIDGIREQPAEADDVTPPPSALAVLAARIGVILARTTRSAARVFKTFFRAPRVAPWESDEAVAATGDEDEVTDDLSLWVFSINGWFRRALIKLTMHRRFENLILVAIVASSAALAMERPDMPAGERAVLDVLNNVLNGLFTFECVAKVVAMGALPYLRSNWNRLDLIVVAFALADSLSASSGLRALRILRIFRALRPLRVIARAEGLRIVILTLTHAVWPIMHTLFIALLCFAVFALLGIQLFGGALAACSDPTVANRRDCTGTTRDGAARVWTPRPINFDHFGKAFLAVLQLSSGDNWSDFLWDAVAATTPSSGPVEYFNEPAALFFVAMILVGSFFILNIFVGVFVDAYRQSSVFVARARVRKVTKVRRPTSARVVPDGAAADGDHVAKGEGELAAAEGPIAHAHEHRPPSLRHDLCALVNDPRFDVFVAAAICGNIATMAFESFRGAQWQLTFLTITNYFFTLFFGAEAALKLYAVAPRGYFDSNWNRFDFVVVVVSFGGIVADISGAAIAVNPTLLRVLRVARVFRILRAFRIFRAAKGLQTLLSTVFKSLPPIANLIGTLALLFFVGAVLAVEIFSQLCVVGDLRPQCAFVAPPYLLDPHAHFQNAGMALLALFRVATADDWGPLMSACGLVPLPRAPDALSVAGAALRAGDAQGVAKALGGCLTDAEVAALGICDVATDSCGGTCGQPIGAPIFFVVFVCLTNFVLLNLIVAVLMQQLSDIQSSSDKQLSEHVHFNDFFRIVARWKKKARGKFSERAVSKSREQIIAGRWLAAGLLGRSSMELRPTGGGGGPSWRADGGEAAERFLNVVTLKSK